MDCRVKPGNDETESVASTELVESKMAYWLLKTEPETFSWDDQVKRGAKGEPWTGVRNFIARGHLKAMKKGEHAFFYHTGEEKQVVGIVEVIRESYRDPTDEKGVFLAVDVKAVGRRAPQGHGPRQISAPLGAAGHRAGMENRVRAGRREGLIHLLVTVERRGELGAFPPPLAGEG